MGSRDGAGLRRVVPGMTRPALNAKKPVPRERHRLFLKSGR
jgi:hypothetical protein